MSPQPSGDLTPEVSSPTDIAPLGKGAAASVDAPYDWDAIARDPGFAELKAAKRRFIIPGTIFFLIYYMTLPVLVGFFPEVMKAPVLGKVNWAYIYALSQFIMTWTICAMYVRTARRWDEMNAKLLSRFPHR